MKITFESKGNFDAITDWLKRASTVNTSSMLNSIASEGVRALAESTPQSTGGTASGWASTITKRGDVTEIAWTNTAHPGTSANVAKLIELGHGTRTGGYVPPRPYIKNAMAPVWSRLDDKVVKGLTK